MIFEETPIPGAFVIVPEQVCDVRGSFARTWCHYEFESRGLNSQFVQSSTSFNHRAGTLRGLHFQRAPHLEAKLVRCTRGRAFDVIVDLRRESPAFGRWFATEIGADDGHMMFIPEGVAHGFQTLEDATEILYQISTYYAPDYAAGLRWDDPDIGIAWPEAEERTISEKDRELPAFHEVFEAATPRQVA